MKLVHGIHAMLVTPFTSDYKLNEDALRNLRWIVLIFMPLIPALIGTVIWWQRRV